MAESEAGLQPINAAMRNGASASEGVEKEGVCMNKKEELQQEWLAGIRRHRNTGRRHSAEILCSGGLKVPLRTGAMRNQMYRRGM